MPMEHVEKRGLQTPSKQQHIIKTGAIWTYDGVKYYLHTCMYM